MDIACQDPNSQAGYYGRVVGQKTMKALGLLQIAQGTSEIVTGLGGFGVSLGAEFASLGVVSGVAIPVAGVSVGLIASGAAKVGVGVYLLSRKSNEEYYDHNLDKQYKGMSKSREAQDKQFRGAMKQIEKKLGRKLKQGEIRKIHYAIHGQNYGYWEIVEEGIEMLRKF